MSDRVVQRSDCTVYDTCHHLLPCKYLLYVVSACNWYTQHFVVEAAQTCRTIIKSD